MLPSTPQAAPAPPRSLAFGDCVLDLAAQQLLRSGVAVPLAPRCFAVLVHLAGQAGRLVEKDELLDAVWGHRSVSDSALTVAINAVRAALGDSSKAPRHIETVSRRGYRFVARIRAAAGPALSGALTVAGAGQLPAPQPGLIGREADLQRLQAALATQRLVTLHGPGGVGKTRLALAGAGHDAPADGVWLLRLDTLADAGPLLATVARTLGLGAGADASPSALARALAGLRLRLVIDNAEHLLPAVAALTATLLAETHGVQMLVTSQLPLHLAGEQLLPVAPLDVPARHLAEGDEPGPALRLLLERVHQQAPALVPDAAALADAVAICRALDGLPLALELAASRVPLLGWRGVRERLDDRLQLLSDDPVGGAERHRTLRAALDWTCAMLATGERQLLQSLSLFAGSFTVEAALALAPPGVGDPLDALDSLREHSLLVRSGDALPPRWRLYDSVRGYAAEGLQAGGGQAAAVRRLVAHMTAVFQAAEDTYAGLPLLQWTRGLQVEIDNLRAALQLALADPALQAEAVALHAASTCFRVRGGWRREVLRDHQAVQALPPARLAALPACVRAELDLATAQLAAIGQMLPPEPALQAARRAAAVFEQQGLPQRLHVALYLEAGLQMRLRAPFDERREVLRRAAACEPAHWGLLQRRHRIWLDLMLQNDQGELQAFEDGAWRLMAQSRVLHDDHLVWTAAQALAQMMVVQGRTAEATEVMQQTVAEMRRSGELRAYAHVLAQLAALRILADANPDSAALLQEAAGLMHAEGRLWWMADALPWLPAWQGRWADAARIQAWADALVRERGEQRGRLFGTLRARFGAWLDQQPQALDLQALLAADPSLDEAAVLAIAFAVA